jgi:hypothetical protein
MIFHIEKIFKTNGASVFGFDEAGIGLKVEAFLAPLMQQVFGRIGDSSIAIGFADSVDEVCYSVDICRGNSTQA